jgi:hypothetical protein
MALEQKLLVGQESRDQTQLTSTGNARQPCVQVVKKNEKISKVKIEINQDGELESYFEQF